MGIQYVINNKSAISHRFNVLFKCINKFNVFVKCGKDLISKLDRNNIVYKIDCNH